MANVETITSSDIKNGHANGNSSPTEEKKETKLDVLHKAFIAAKKNPTKKEMVAAMKLYDDAKKSTEALQSQIAKAKAAEYEAAEAVIKLVGRTPFTFNGQTYIPACKEHMVFFKTPGKVEGERNF